MATLHRGAKALVVGLVVGVLGGLLAVSPGGFDLEENVGLRALFRMRGPVAPPRDVAIVTLDSESAVALDLPTDFRKWSRAWHAVLVDRLADANAAVIVFDVLFRESRTEDGQDEAFGEAIARAGRVVLYQQIARPADGHDIIVSPVRQLHEAAAGVAPMPLPKVAERVFQFWTHKNLAEPVPTLPVVALRLYARPALRAFAAGLAAADRLPRGSFAGAAGDAALLELLHRAGGEPARLEALLQDLARHNGRPLAERDRRALLALSRLQASPHAYRYINYYGPPGSIRTIPFHRLAGDRPLAEDLSDAAVFVGFVGAAATDTEDSFKPIFPRRDAVDMSGVEITATAFANLLDGTWIRPLAVLALFGTVAAFGAATAGLAYLLPGVRGAAIILALAAAYLGAAHLLFGQARLWLPVFVPLALQLPIALAIAVLAQYVEARRLFATYVPGTLVRSLLRRVEAGPPTSVERSVTVLFTDIAGFTGLAERMSSEEIGDLLAHHFELISRCVQAEDGTIDKFIGDAVMAFWAESGAGGDHAERACRAALAIRSAIRADNAARRARGLAPVRVRIGVNTGRAQVGSVGGAGRMNYTVLGDSVNVAQRLEQLCKTACPADEEAAILIGDDTAKRLGPAFAPRPAGRHHLKGRGAKSAVFQLH